MIRFCIPFFIITALVSCAKIPALKPLPAVEGQQAKSRCQSAFPSGNWQVVHAIEADIYGKKSMLMGVTVLRPEQREAHAVLMTIEGFVVFEAVFNTTASVKRAVPPFDKKGLAHGLMSDLFLIFFAPQTKTGPETGLDEKGRVLCRYTDVDGRIIDVLDPLNRNRQIFKYDVNGNMSRRVSSDFNGGGMMGFPRTTLLVALGAARYRLKMTLVSADPLLP